MQRKDALALSVLVLVTAHCAGIKRPAPMGVWKEGASTVNKVVKVMPNYVVISTYPGIEEKRQTVNVFRLVDRKMITVGRVRVVQYKNHLALAEVLHSKRKYGFERGDFVHLKYKPLDRMNVGEYIDYIARNEGETGL